MTYFTNNPSLSRLPEFPPLMWCDGPRP